MKLPEDVAQLLTMGIHDEFIGLRYVMLTELPKKPCPLSVTEPFDGPDIGETSNDVLKLNVNGLPKPVTVS